MTNEMNGFIEVDYTSAPPAAERVQELLNVIAPGSTLAGNHSNKTHVAEVVSAAGKSSRIVLLFSIGHLAECPKKYCAMQYA